MVWIQFIFLGILSLTITDDVPKDRKLFISPVKIPLAFSANFGELRTDHFHSGLDIKTQGVTGKEVVAAADGYIYRISVAAGGFGKSLYVRHPSGYSTVYAHLDRFTDNIDKYVLKSQYERRSFAVNLYPQAGQFSVKQGDLIAFSGNSGSSSGPHLHYEIRKSSDEKPINPLLFEFGSGDDIYPVIEKVAIYPAKSETLINSKCSPLKIPVSGGNGNYYLSSDNPLIISGIAGFGIKSYDLLNDSYNRCSVYSIDLFIDSALVFRYVMDGFSFSESRFVNSHIDYETFIKERTYFERAFRLPNDRLSAYRDEINRGLFDFTDSARHNIEIVVSDIHGNRSSLKFQVLSQPKSQLRIPQNENEAGIPMHYNRPNRFRAENIYLTIPGGALYDTIAFQYEKGNSTPEMFSDIHHIHNSFTPLHLPYSISIKPTIVPAGKESKLLLIQMNDDFVKTAVGGIYKDGYVTAEAGSFGMFFVGIDTIPPAINANGLTEGSDLSDRKELKIRITDDLSGIKSYEAFIDGNWELFEYDQKNSILILRFNNSRISDNSDHKLILRVTDNRDNESEFTCRFRR